MNNAIDKVLNLIINGIPSILRCSGRDCPRGNPSFKPYYKWNTFNTNGKEIEALRSQSFKPYYKWNTFNTRCI